MNARLMRNASLLRTLVLRELEARSKGSWLGRLWPMVSQLALLLMYVYVFSVVLRVKIPLRGVPESAYAFGVWLFAGLLPWLAFSNGLGQSAVSVIAQPNLVKKVVFPLELLPLVPVLTAFVEMLLGLAALLVLLAILFGHVPWTALLLPAVWLPQLLLTVGLAYAFASVTVFLRDTPHALAIALNVGFFLTPIVYPIASVPARLQPWVMALNPMASVAELYRDVLLTGTLTHGKEYGLLLAVSAAVGYGGYTWYRKVQSGFADVI